MILVHVWFFWYIYKHAYTLSFNNVTFWSWFSKSGQKNHKDVDGLPEEELLLLLYYAFSCSILWIEEPSTSITV